MDIDVKSKDIQSEYEIMSAENIENINISNGKIQEVVKRAVDIIGGIFGTLLLIPITVRNIYRTKNTKR